MPRTIVCFHAHPDDEAILTGGTMALAAAAGHAVHLVFATDGCLGELQGGFVLPDGVDICSQRRSEAEASAAVLGAAGVHFLGYRDSGMMGADSNTDPDCFWQADVDAAAGHLAELLTAVGADILTVYDANGGYGHPDHIQVHRVGLAAAARAATPVVLEATTNRDAIQDQIRAARASGDVLPEDLPSPEEFDMGVPAAQITTTIDVRAVLAPKRAAMAAHTSQIGPESFFLAMPDEMFALAFGTEWFVRRGAPVGTAETDILAGFVTT